MGKILFIVLDQLRGDVLTGALGTVARLPNIRALAAEGVTFAGHFTVTNPCGPARASLLTGLYAMNHRSVRNGAPLSRHLTNVALELRKAGYEPLLFGYTDTTLDPTGLPGADPALRSYESVLPGFTEVVEMRFDSGLSWLAELKARGYPLPKRYLDVYRAVDPEGLGRLDAPTMYRAEDSDTAFLTNETLKALAVREDRDWFAHVTYIRPHPPLAAPAPWNRAHDPASLPPPARRREPEGERAVHPFFDAYFSEPTVRNLYIGFDGRLERIPDDDLRTLRAIYLGLAEEVDHHIGRLVDYLRESGQYDDTLIIVTGDHGEMLGDHWQWGKESIYEPAFHVPLVIRDPRRRDTAGRVVHALTESVDLAPTILDWHGIEVPEVFDGRSLLPFLDGEMPADWRSLVFAELDLADPAAPTRYQRRLGLSLEEANVAFVREARFKYVHFNGGLPPLLFDLEHDPGEFENLAGDPRHRDELLRLARRMLDHRMSHASQELSLLSVTPEGVKRATRRARPVRDEF